MKCDKRIMRLYAVTDRAWVGEKTLVEQIEDALKGGVTCVQLREKELAEELFLQEAHQIHELCKQYEVPFIINDNVDIAVACGADGVHVGQKDMNIKLVREKLKPQQLIGVSVQTVEQAILAEQEGASYLGVGAVFSTSTKSDAIHVTYETLKSICEAVSIPVVAIGGINEDNVLQLAHSGIDGIAVVSALFSQKDITHAAQNLYQLGGQL